MVCKIRPGKRKNGAREFRIGNAHDVAHPIARCKPTPSMSMIFYRPRICQRCGVKFYIAKTDKVNKKRGAFKPDIPKIHEEDGLRITPWPSQKICPDCKDREKEKPQLKICEWCEKPFTPARRHAKTCSPACRKMLSLHGKKPRQAWSRHNAERKTIE
jgi:hypothetical protein